MLHGTKLAVIVLDFILIMMTATWIIVSVYRGMSNVEWIYNYTYVILNMVTLVLNLKLIRTS